MKVDTSADLTPQKDAVQNKWEDRPPEEAENSATDLPCTWIQVAVYRGCFCYNIEVKLRIITRKKL